MIKIKNMFGRASHFAAWSLLPAAALLAALQQVVDKAFLSGGGPEFRSVPRSPSTDRVLQSFSRCFRDGPTVRYAPLFLLCFFASRPPVFIILPVAQHASDVHGR